MCLEIVDKETKQIKYGWKVFMKKGRKLVAPCYGNDEHFAKGIWYDEVDFRRFSKQRKTIDSASGKRYKKGFHVFVSYREAKFWGNNENVIKKVEVKDIVASGTQRYHVVIVAKKLKVIE